MQTIEIDILNPKVLSILENLVDLELIRFKEKSKDDFLKLVNKIRNNSDIEINEDEIAYEVKAVRKSRNEGK